MESLNDTNASTEIEMEHQCDNALHIDSVNNNDSFNIFKPKILIAIHKIKDKKKRADIDSIHDFIAQTKATNIDKNNIKDFVTKLIAQKLVIKKKTPQGYESYHKISYSIRTSTKENFNKTSEEVASGTQTDFVFNSMYVKNDVLDAFYEDYIQYKGYANDIINKLISKEDSLHRTEEENTTEHRKNFELLEKKIKDLKRENQILKEILTSKFEKNNDNNSNGSKTFEKTNTNNTWKAVKTNRVNNFDNKGNNREFNPISVKNKYQPNFIGENEVTEPHIDDEINDDVNQNNNVYNNNINNNVMVRRKRPTTVLNQSPERGILGTNITKQSKSIIPGSTKYSEVVRFGRKAYVLGTSMVKGIKRNEFNSFLKKCNTRFRPFIGATIKQMEIYVKPIICDNTPDVVILHIGCNDISNRNISANDIVEGIINIGKYCKEQNVNDVIISSLICRTQHHLRNKVNAVNEMLMQRCKIYGLGYIDDSNIKVECLAQDGLHLNEIRKCCLANNFINFLNVYIL